MQTEVRKVVEALALNDAGTEPIDLDFGENISFLEIIVNGTKGSTENQSDKLQDHISEIQIKDGGKFISGCSGQELVIVNAAETKQRNAADLELFGSGTPQETFYFFGGLMPYDPDHYYPFKGTRYKKPQLFITTNLTAGVTKYATGTLTVDVNAHVIISGENDYKGHLMIERHNNWTTLASGDEPTELPVDGRLRFLVVKSLESGISPVAGITNLKLTADPGNRIIFDNATADIVLQQRNRFGELEEKIVTKAQDTDVVLSTFSEVYSVNIHGGDEDFTVKGGVVTAESVVITASDQT